MKTITQFQSIESFSTDRLYALKITLNDLDKLIAMHANTQIMATLGGVRNINQSKQILESHLNRWQEQGFGSWMFYLKSTNEFIGRGSMRRLEVADNEEVEIGYAVLPDFLNKGFGTDIAKACLEISFEVLRLDNVVCFCENSNLASKRVIEKVGFQYEKDFMYEGVLHVLYRMKNIRKVEIVKYDSKWPETFNNESLRIQQVLSNHLREIYHIGSTAIPNMPAKPVIDILLVFENLDFMHEITKYLNSLNYYNIRRQIIPHRSFFVRRQDHKISFNVHIHERGSMQINRHVNFRDYLINHKKDAERYATLKLELAEKHRDNLNAYVFGKDKLVQEIDTKAKLWDGRKKNYLPTNLGPKAENWMQENIVKAMVANMNVHMTHFAQYLNAIELIRIPGFTIVNSGLADDTFNYVLDADFLKGDANNKIQEITNYFTQNKIPFSWWVSPHDKPDNLSNYLENNGYINTENNTAMYFDLDAWDGNTSSIAELTIVEAKDKQSLIDFALVLANDKNSFKKYFEWISAVLTDDDPIEYYVGYVNGIPVVRGLSCYFAQVAGLHWLSTLPSERKKGYGKAMQEFRLKRAKDLGYHIAVLQASHEGHSLYKKIGYKECGVFKEFKLIERDTP